MLYIQQHLDLPRVLPHLQHVFARDIAHTS